MAQLRNSDPPLTSLTLSLEDKFTIINETTGVVFNLRVGDLLDFVNSNIVDVGPPASGQGTYYFDATGGDDTADGRTPATAFQSITKFNSLSYLPNDQIFFKRGQTHNGALVLTYSSGSTGLPILITGYGTGLIPVIASGAAVGFTATNKHHVTIDGIDFLGGVVETNGSRTPNAVDGIHIENNQSGDGQLAGIRITNCTVREYGHSGIHILGNNGAAGFEAPLLDNNIVYHCTHNTSGGLQSAGIRVASIGFGSAGFGYSHTGVVIRSCTTRDNFGTLGDASWNGSGIYVGQTDVASITKCIAYGNGVLSNNPLGPYGIYIEDCNEAVVQECESYLNRLNASLKDGGGFMLGGGCTGCVIERCYSHENDGNGFKLYASAAVNLKPWDGNTLRYCISQGDHKIAFDLGGSVAVVADENMINVRVHNNTIYQNGGSPRNALMLRSTTGVLVTDYEGYIANNIINTRSTSSLVQADSMNTTFMRLRGNNYHAEGSFIIEWNSNDYTSLAAWQAAFVTQEKISAVNVATTLDPQFASPNNGGTLNANNAMMSAYKLRSSSPMIGTGLDLEAEFTIDPGTLDFFSTAVADPFNVGASYLLLDVPLTISGAPEINAVEDEIYAGFTVAAAGGDGNYTYALSGSWPAGITVHATTGAVTGTPTDAGTFADLSITVTDGLGATASLPVFTLTVAVTSFDPTATQVPNGTDNGTILYTIETALPTPVYSIFSGGVGLALDGANVIMADKSLFFPNAGAAAVFRATSGASVQNFPVEFQVSAGYYDPGILGGNVGMWWDAIDHRTIQTDEGDTYIVKFADKSPVERHMVNPWMLDRRQRLITASNVNGRRAMRSVAWPTSSTYGLTCREHPIWHGMRFIKILTSTSIEMARDKAANNNEKTVFTGLPPLFGSGSHIVVIHGDATTCTIRIDGVVRGTKTVGAGYYPPDNPFVVAWSMNISSTVFAQILSNSHLGQHPFWEGGAFAGDVVEFFQAFNVTGVA